MTIIAYSENPVLRLWKGVHYGKTSGVDQFSCQACQDHLGYRPKSSATLLGGQITSRFYPSTANCYTCVASILPNRLPRYPANTLRIFRPSQGNRPFKSAALYHNPESPVSTAKKRAWDRIQTAIFSHAKAIGLTATTEASIDSTGLESRFVSRHFLMRQGKRTNRYRRWTKLTIVADNETHLIAAAEVSLGPSNDSPLLPEAVRQAIEHIPIKRLLGDAGYDSEDNQRICRKEFDIPSTVIPINNRNGKCDSITGHYRNQMKRRFPKRVFGNRWQIESVFSRFKRKLGYALRAVTEQSRATECLVRVMTYNLMILHLLVKYVFYRAISINYF